MLLLLLLLQFGLLSFIYREWADRAGKLGMVIRCLSVGSPLVLDTWLILLPNMKDNIGKNYLKLL